MPDKILLQTSGAFLEKKQIRFLLQSSQEPGLHIFPDQKT